MKKSARNQIKKSVLPQDDTPDLGLIPDVGAPSSVDATAEPGEVERSLVLSSAMEATSDALIIVDLNNNVLLANRNFAALFNIDADTDQQKFTTSALTLQISNTALDADRFVELMQYSVEYPDEPTIDIIPMKNGRILERRSFANVVNGTTVGCVISFRDVTDRVTKESALLESAKGYKELFEKNPYPVWVFDTETLEILAVNNEAIRRYGYSRTEFLNLTIKDIRPKEDLPSFTEFMRTTRSEREVFQRTRHKTKYGLILEVEIAAQSITYAQRPARIVVVTDAAERKRDEVRLKETESRITTLLDSMSEGLLQVDLDDRIVFTNKRFCEMSGYQASELVGTSWSRLIVDKNKDFLTDVKERRRKGISDRYELRLRKRSGDIMWVIIGGAPIIDEKGQLAGSIGVLTDITDRKRTEERLRHDALHDALTGLANRTLFMDHLRAAIDRGTRNKKPFAVLYLDFDRFKVINDSLGHAEGDKLLKYIARRLENCTRTGDLVARLGGDEFVILLHELVDTSEALLVAERIQNDLKLSFDLGGREIYTTTSIGIVLSTAGHAKAEDMIRDADIAMYYAKAKGKAQYQIFDQSMLQRASKKLQIETEMRLAIARNDFKMFYQPIVSLSTGSLVGFESLLRWEHQERGQISPDEFIPIAEETGMILKLGSWAIEESCRQLRAWQMADPKAEGLTISVNLSSKEFLQMDLVERIASTLKSTGLNAEYLKIEITESHIMENSELAVKIIDKLRDLGIEMSLDDFGTGYSSLSYLHRLPVSFLKIDRSFVTRMGDSGENREIVQTIVRLAQNLKMSVIAEGIESMEQLTDLSNMGCDFGQGYLFAPPLDHAAAMQFIAEKGVAKSITPVFPPGEQPDLVM